MKQETLEEANIELSKAVQQLSYDGLSIKEINAFKNGTKWQAERGYSDAIEFGKWLDDNAQQREYYPMSAMTMEELFEQHKKK
jgi:hypothetical protein